MSNDDKEMASTVFFPVPSIGHICRGSFGAAFVLYTSGFHL